MNYNLAISKWVLEREDILNAYGDILDPESVFKTEVAAAIVLFDTSEDSFNWMYNNMLVPNIERAEYAMATDERLLPFIKGGLLAQYKRNALGFVMNIKDSGNKEDMEVDFADTISPNTKAQFRRMEFMKNIILNIRIPKDAVRGVTY